MSCVGHGPVTGSVFIVSSGRSGSTLLRLMLAGHSELFAPPELNLLAFHDVAQLLETLGPCPTAACAALGCDMVDGLRRAVMEALRLDGESSKRVVDSWAEEKRATTDVYRIISDAIAPRALVDKSPLYTLRREFLPRAEKLFDSPRYIYLVRHPKAAILSRARDDVASLLLHWATEGKASRNLLEIEAAELLWRLMTNNASEFLDGIPAERKITVRFEDLVRSPSSVLRQICTFLGVSFQQAVLRPYDGNRMRDGVTKGTIAAGSRDVHHHRRVDPREADAWRKESVDWRLGDATKLLAEAIGYEL